MRKSFSAISIGLKQNSGARLRKANLRKRSRMGHWRDRARRNLLEARRRYKEKVEKNKAIMKERKSASEKNNNPTFAPLKVTVARKPYLAVSLVPPKPRYSSVPPEPRLYGIRLELTDARKLVGGKLIKSEKAIKHGSRT